MKTNKYFYRKLINKNKYLDFKKKVKYLFGVRGVCTNINHLWQKNETFIKKANRYTFMSGACICALNTNIAL